ncbi:MAG: hypothetical protein Q9191_005017 [Dirinaria sp. TL-2023a]
MRSSEAQRFRHDNPLPAHSPYHYDIQRAARYRGVTKGQDPYEANAVYDQYKRASSYNDAVRETYTNSYAEQEAIVQARPQGHPRESCLKAISNFVTWPTTLEKLNLGKSADKDIANIDQMF